MAYTTIDDPSAYFNTLLWTGNGADNRALTNNANAGNFQPDFVWVKGRSQAEWHNVYDSSRGANKGLYPNSTYQEESLSQTFESFDTNGFTVSYNSAYNSVFTNKNSTTYVAWQWKVNGGTTTSLSSNINSVCQVNQDAGISIVKYTCTGGGNGQAVQHGLGLVPQVIITKNRTDTSYSDWITYHHSIGYTNFLKLNTDAAQAGSSPYNGAEPTSSTYNVSIDLVEATKDYVSYVFAPIQGYSKFGSYVGNGSGTSDGTYDGAFVYLGFKPAWVLIKRSSYSAGDGWVLFDSTRPPRGGSTTGNYNQNKLNPASDAAESGAVYDAVDFLSNGFKARTGRAGVNASGSTYIYMAFAENPFVTSTGIPTTAR
jgi:hypothetical protein